MDQWVTGSRAARGASVVEIYFCHGEGDDLASVSPAVGKSQSSLLLGFFGDGLVARLVDITIKKSV